MFDWAKKLVGMKDDTPIEQLSVDPKLLAENTQVLAGLTDLAAKLGASSKLDEAMDRNLQKLRQEGSGL